MLKLGLGMKQTTTALSPLATLQRRRIVGHYRIERQISTGKAGVGRMSTGKVKDLLFQVFLDRSIFLWSFYFSCSLRITV